VDNQEDICEDNNDHQQQQHSFPIIANSDNENTLDRCYQCIICQPMFFSKKSSLKKRLWRSRVTTSAATTNTPTNAQSRTTHNQHQHQQPNHYYQNQNQYQYLSNETSTDSYYCQSMSQPHDVGVAAREEGCSLLKTTTAVLTNCCSNTNSTSTIDLAAAAANSTAGNTEQRKFRSLMNQLKKENQLETLCQAIEYGIQKQQYQPTDCVLVQRGLIDGEEPQVIACRLWRWSDLYDSHAIKRIPTCPNEKDPVYVCCNPAHWSRVHHIGKFHCSIIN
jgi:hypothetical protein